MTLTTRKQQDLTETLQDLITWCNELKTERYGHKRLSGVEQSEYFRLIQTVEQANKWLVELRRVDYGN